MSISRPKPRPGKPASKFLHCEFVVAGRRYRGSTYTADRRQAQEFEAKWRRRILDQVHYGILPAMTMGEACVAYFQERVMTGSSINLKATTRGAKYVLAAILRRFGKETSPDRITKEGIADQARRSAGGPGQSNRDPRHEVEEEGPGA